MLTIFGISFATIICAVILKEKSPHFSLIIAVVGSLIIFGSVIFEIKELIATINSITEPIKSSLSYIKLMIKVLLISILTQFVTDVCRDNGLNSLASIIEIAIKILIITLVLPIFQTIITMVLGLLK